MSTAVIIIIVVVVVVLILAAAALLSPQARVKRRERELEKRREGVVEGHRQEAGVRNERAQKAEQRAQLAEAEAQRERAEAQVQSTRAQVHEEGLADHELIDDNERKHFKGTSAVQGDPDADAAAGGRGAEGRGEEPTGRAADR